MRALCSNNQCFIYSFSALASPLCITFCILSLIVHSFIIHHRERFFSFVCVYSQPNGLGKIMRSSSPCSPRSWVGRLELSFSRIMTLTFLSADIFDQGFLLLKPSHCPCQSLNDQCVGKYYRKAHWAILILFFHRAWSSKLSDPVSNADCREDYVPLHSITGLNLPPVSLFACSFTKLAQAIVSDADQQRLHILLAFVIYYLSYCWHLRTSVW